MSRKYLKLTTIALGIVMFICGLSISFSPVTAASTSGNPEYCYDEFYGISCPPQTTATVTVSDSSTYTVNISTSPNGQWTLNVPVVGSLSIPAIGGKTTSTVTGTNGTVYTLVINIDNSYRVLS